MASSSPNNNNNNNSDDNTTSTATMTTTALRSNSHRPVNLAIDIALANANHNTVKQALSTNRAYPPTHNKNNNNNNNNNSKNPLTPPGYRGHADLRSPGAQRTPLNAATTATAVSAWNFDNDDDDSTNNDKQNGENEEERRGGKGEYLVGLSKGGTAANTTTASVAPDNDDQHPPPPTSPLADFITQTDRHGNASTPRSAESIANARKLHPSGPKPILHVDAKTGNLVETGSSGTKDTLDEEEDEEDDHSEDALLKNNNNNVEDHHRPPAAAAASMKTTATAAGGATTALEHHHHHAGEGGIEGGGGEDACDTILDSFRMMCCCLLPEDGSSGGGGGVSGATKEGQNGGSSGGGGTTRGGGDKNNANVLYTPDKNNNNTNINNNTNKKRNNYSSSNSNNKNNNSHPIGYSTRGHDAPLLLEEDSALCNNPNNIKLLPELHVEDFGKRCLVLDLDETLVHSSFRAVAGADFVIPVQIEDVIHYVYVAKRPGVENFLLEMSKHYELVVYTASLNKYADVLLDLLDPHRVIRTRLFRESCVFYEGNYVKDLCLLNRDLSQVIIIDNSPASYMFHPENAIDCSSFIDDVNDRELDQIGKFLVGLATEERVVDVRGTVTLWRHWPNVDLTQNHYRKA